MDKREEKTINAIHSAFSKLINEKDYDDITIQDILDISKVSRSTFYAHYKTKDELLISISNHIFEHVFSHSLQEERTHDFSKDEFYDYRSLISHIFYHVKDEKDLFIGILSNKTNALFLLELRKHISKLVNSYFNNYPYRDLLFPLELRKDLAVESFIVVLNYWVKSNFLITPEEIADLYIKSILQ